MGPLCSCDPPVVVRPDENGNTDEAEKGFEAKSMPLGPPLCAAWKVGMAAA